MCEHASAQHERAGARFSEKAGIVFCSSAAQHAQLAQGRLLVLARRHVPGNSATKNIAAMMQFRAGIDVGGTNTDCVILSAANEVLGSAKVLTTDDVLLGVQAALRGALVAADVPAGSLSMVALGTTAFVNACVQLRGLHRVAVLRLCGPASRSLPPFVDLPPGLRDAVAGYSACLSGGYEYDGRREISPLDEAELRAHMRSILERDIQAVVVSGVFSPVQPAQEDAAVRILREEAAASGAAHVMFTASHSLGQLGLLERENAAVINAALRPLARRVVPACVAAVRAAGVAAPLLFTANDGTLISEASARRAPILTFQSGPVNSLRGAAALTGLRDAVVIDIGGTTTDVGVLRNGLPRPAPRAVHVAGAVTNFQMPDIWSCGLGGGSLLHFEGESACSVGPLSVGSALLWRAACVGGAELTATDAAVVLGRMKVGRAAAAEARLSAQRAQRAWAEIQRILAGAVDVMKDRAGDVAVVVVGGGADLCDDSLPGASAVIRPPHADVANAVGAAIPEVAGCVDSVLELGPSAASRAAALDGARREAIRRAERAGAEAGSCEIAALDVLPLAYLPGTTARVCVKAVGRLDLEKLHAADLAARLEVAEDENNQRAAKMDHKRGDDKKVNPAGPASAGHFPGRGDEMAPAALANSNWAPQVDATGAWVIQEADLHLLAVGTGILGCGGGGSPGRAKLKALLELQRDRSCSGRMRVIHPASLPKEGLVLDASFMGAPTVGLEKLDSDQARTAADAVLGAYHSMHSTATRVPLVGVVCGEVGGGNGIEPLALAAGLGVPLLDGDFMGRAFPELHMMTPAIYSASLAPAALADEKGNVVVVRSVHSAPWLERLLRPVCTEMGCSAGYASCPLTVREVRRLLVPHTLSLAWRLGRAVAEAQHAKRDAADAVAGLGGGRVLFRGKIVEVERRTTEGFAQGRMQLQGRGDSEFAGQRCEIVFQNENLMARVDGELAACVPDLICCLEEENGLPIATEEARYGLRSAVVALPAPPLLRTAEALAVVGPGAFGLSGAAYSPVGPYNVVEPVPKGPESG